ncbi:MAG: PTS sugar transporter subunit IIA [Spirochaetales bacterium]
MDRRNGVDRFFTTGSVVWELESSDKYEAIREVIYRAPVFSTIPGLDLREFAELVVNREHLLSTGFGHGVAVAHGRTPAVEESHIALGVSRHGIDYVSPDGQPVHLLFVVANHPEQQMDYLQIISTLARLLRNDAFRRELLSCVRGDEVEQKMYTAFSEYIRPSAAYGS